MPTLRNRTQNGFKQNMDADILLAKKSKLSMVSEYYEQEPDSTCSKTENKLNSITKNASTSNGTQETFSDTQTMAFHSKLQTDQQSDPIIISCNNYDPNNNATNLGQTIRDQFAVALLRLQSNLDSTTKRLDSLEAKVDSLTKQHERQQQQQRTEQQRKQQAQSRSKALLSSANVGHLVYLSWPVLVYLALRALERRAARGVGVSD